MSVCECDSRGWGGGGGGGITNKDGDNLNLGLRLLTLSTEPVCQTIFKSIMHIYICIIVNNNNFCC